MVRRDRDKGHRVQPMFNRKALGLGQRFTGHNGDMGRRALHPPVIGQIADIIGGAAFQRRGDLRAARVIVGAGGLDLQIQDLRRRDHQFRRNPLGRQAKGRAAQVIQCGGKIGVTKGNRADIQPAPSRSVQERNALFSQVKRKTRFHIRGLA